MYRGMVMMSDWINTTIGEQATLQRGIDITKAKQRDGSVPVVSSGGISSYHDTAAVSGPGVVLGRKGVGLAWPGFSGSLRSQSVTSS